MGPLPGLHDARGKLGLSIHLAVWQQNQVIAQSCNVVQIGQCTIWVQWLNILGAEVDLQLAFGAGYIQTFLLFTECFIKAMFL